MIKKIARLYVLVILALVFGVVLEFGGSYLNAIAEGHNNNHMPVWVMNGGVALSIAISPSQCDLTEKSRYKALCDIIPQPFIDAYNQRIDIQMMSVGDVAMSAGEFVILASIVAFLFAPLIFIFKNFRHS